jgi:hypothetical protein
LTEEKNDLLNFINLLIQSHGEEVYTLEHQPLIPVPHNNAYGMPYEIKNGLLGANRDIFIKTTRNPTLTDADLQQMMGTSPRTAIYRYNFFFGIENCQELTMNSPHQ